MLQLLKVDFSFVFSSEWQGGFICGMGFMLIVLWFIWDYFTFER